MNPDQPARDFTAYARDWDSMVGFAKAMGRPPVPFPDFWPAQTLDNIWPHLEARQAMLAYEGELP